MMGENGFAMGSVRRIARQIIDLSDKKRKQVLSYLESDMRCRVGEEIVKIKVLRGRG